MSLEFVRKLPTPTEIREQYPLSARATEIKKQRDAEIAKVFTGDSDKFLVIVGTLLRRQRRRCSGVQSPSGKGCRQSIRQTDHHPACLYQQTAYHR